METEATEQGDPGTGAHEPLWLVEDVAAYLRITPKGIYHLVDAGRLPCVRIGSRLRFVPSIVAAWVNEGAASQRERSELRGK
jgi:excisionase family DNA binding protein